TDGPVYLSVPFLMKSAPVSIYCNGKCIYKEESTSYYSVIVDAGIHGQGELITFEIRCDDDVLACFEPYAAETDLKALFEQTEILKKGISGLSVKDGYVTFSTESSKEQLLITTIPYEKGWSAKVDGKDVEIVPYQDAFICIPLDAGSHDVQLQFDPPGARIGGIISALGVFACAALIFCTRKSGKVKQQRREQD
ncbi:MAG: YfhO family protein, partial [Clostridiales bacterium]|nr:YfhO family protein [Clostridiales bacterium]